MTAADGLRPAIAKLVRREHLTRAEARASMAQLMEGQPSPVQIAALLTALASKGETVEELTGMAESMRSAAITIAPRVNGRLIDTCGTGGAPVKTFNFSTAGAFVAAGAGVPVAKHGNRSSTGICGSADVLEALGARLDSSPEAVQACIEKVGVGFLFAPSFHPAMKHAAPIRKELGIRTVFNLLGPLTNPARVRGHLMGVPSPDLVEPMARVLANLGVERAMVVHGAPGVDELSTLGETLGADVAGGRVTMSRVHARDLGLKLAKPEQVAPLPPPDAASEFRRLLAGGTGPKREMLLLNAGAAIVVGGKAETLADGVEAARESIDSGSAAEKLDRFLKEAHGPP